jgi:hypothetical protein
VTTQDTSAQTLPDAQTTQTAGSDPAAAAPPASAEQGQPSLPAMIVIDGLEVPTDTSTVQDPDLRELYDLKLEAHRQATADQGTKATSPDQPQTPAQTDQGQTAPTTAPATRPTGQPMIPKPRLDEALKKAADAEAAAAYWKGVADGRQPAGKTPAAPENPSTTQTQAPTDLASIKAQRAQLAQDFDDGKLTAADWEQKRQALEDQAQQMWETALLAKLPKASSENDLVLEERTAQIAAQHPYSELVFPVQPDNNPIMDARRATLAAEANANVVSANPGLQPGARADLLYRAELARLTDVYGPIWFPNQPKPAPANQTSATPATPGLSPTAQNRVNKLNLAAQQPPSLAAAGKSGLADSGLNDAAIAKMSDDEIAVLPPQVRAKLTGVAP